jgi:hypothetical protein
MLSATSTMLYIQNDVFISLRNSPVSQKALVCGTAWHTRGSLHCFVHHPPHPIDTNIPDYGMIERRPKMEMRS